MSYHVAKQVGIAVEARAKAAGLALRAVPGVGSGANGLTPDAVKFSPEYRAAKAAHEAALAELRRFNAWFAKAFKAEIAAERRTRRPG